MVELELGTGEYVIVWRKATKNSTLMSGKIIKMIIIAPRHMWNFYRNYIMEYKNKIEKKVS